MQLEEWVGRKVRLKTSLCVRWMKGHELGKGTRLLPSSCVFIVRSVYEQKLDLEDPAVSRHGKPRKLSRVILHVPLEDVILLGL